VNIRHIQGSPAIPSDFTVCTTSRTMRRSEDVYPSYPPLPYTIFVNYLSAARTHLKGHRWAEWFSYSPIFSCS
jgi:hypothetical protein